MSVPLDHPTLRPDGIAGERLSRLHAPSEDELPEAVREIIATTGNPSVRALGLNPGGLLRLFGYLGPLMDPGTGPLPLVERYLIASVVAAENRCISCFLTNSSELGELIEDAERARRIAVNYRNVALSDRERAIARFAVLLTRAPYDVTDAEVDGLRSAGLSDEEVFAVIETTAAFNYTTRISNALAIT